MIRLGRSYRKFNHYMKELVININQLILRQFEMYYLNNLKVVIFHSS